MAAGLGFLDSAQAKVLGMIERSGPGWTLIIFTGNQTLDIFNDNVDIEVHHERSRRVIASLNLALFSVGVEHALSAILKGLESRDYIIRCRIGNAFTYLRPRRHRGSLLAAVERALAAEKTVAAGEALERAARALVTSPSPKIRSSPPRGAARKRTSIR
jgi:hypothetical protein